VSHAHNDELRANLRAALFWTAIATLLLAVRLAHLDVLWVDEAYGLAAARRLLEGERLYSGLWFDKPPLYAWVYAAIGAHTGLALRLLGTTFALLCVWLSHRAAARLFTEPAAPWLAAGLTAFFLSFDHPVALLSLAPDLLLLPFTLAAAWAIAAGRPFTAGLLAGLGLLAHPRALLLLPVLFAFCWSGSLRDLARGALRVTAGFAAAALLTHFAAAGWEEPVWTWGFLYSRDTFVEQPLLEGLRRTANWAGFHLALIAGAALFLWRTRDARLPWIVWMLAAFAMVAAGARFFPRYYLALLPLFVLMTARALAALSPRVRAALLIVTLAVPAIRFGRGHWGIATGAPHARRDLALFDDCRDAATLLRAQAQLGDSLFVWGYRPELNVLANLPGATPFLDSQPLTGVLADRHLNTPRATAPEIAARQRPRLLATRPTFIADGLGPLQPPLAITQFADLRDWFAHYEPIGETRGFRLYRRRP
jgi:hypothetical protein